MGIADLRKVLPDMLRPPAGTATRRQLSKVLWKDIFITEPSSVTAMEQQLVKLVEQALWHMATESAYEVPEAPMGSVECQSQLVDALAGDAIPFEPWMLSSPPQK